MDRLCNPDKLYERKFERGELPIKSCVECLFNVLCNDFIIYEESNLTPNQNKNVNDAMGTLSEDDSEDSQQEVLHAMQDCSR